MPGRASEFVARVAKRIADTRVAAGMTQEALAARLDIATKNVQRLESGKQNLTLGTIERVAAALRTTPESFFGKPNERRSKAAPVSVLARLKKAGVDVRDAADRGRRPAEMIAVMSVKAAAGALSREGRAVERHGWAAIPKAGEGAFIGEVRGDSMSPKISNGALCLFRPLRGSAVGKVALVEHRALADSDGPVVVKKIESVKRLRNGKTKVTLRSANRAYKPIEVVLDDLSELRVLAEFIRVIA